MHLMICMRKHVHLGVAASDRAQTLGLLLGQIERRVLLILAGFCLNLWLTYSMFIPYILHDCRLKLILHQWPV